jgi:hypothetical protein
MGSTADRDTEVVARGPGAAEAGGRTRRKDALL